MVLAASARRAANRSLHQGSTRPTKVTQSRSASLILPELQCFYYKLLKVCSHGQNGKAFSTGVSAYLFFIFPITGNFTTNNALKESFNIMNLRFNFTSNKSLLINKFIFSKRLRKHVRSCCRKPTARTNERTKNVRTRTNVFSQPF